MHPTLIARLAVLREELLALSPDMITDEALLLDTLDGETDALDVVRSIVRAAIDAEGYAGAIERRQNELSARRARFEARAHACRQTAQACMEALDITKLPAEDFTATITAGRPRVVVTDEKLLPPDFITTIARPALAKISSAIREGDTVPGATLSNAVPSLTIRKA